MERTWPSRIVALCAAMGAALIAAPGAWSDSPTLAVSCGGPCNESGTWYDSAVPVTWEVNPAPTAVSGCFSTTYGDVSTTVSCHVWWGPGGTSPDQSMSFPLNVEASSPTASAVPARPPDSNGWYNHPVSVSFVGGWSISGFVACTQSVGYAGPDGTNTVTGSCIDNAGKTATASFALKYDSTPPTITGWKASRRPDHNGWYNHPVSFTFTGADRVSGIERCSRITYSGPASASASAVGSCTNRAGDVATMSVPLKYDSTAPALNVSTQTGDQIVTLHWRKPPYLASFSISRSPGIDGAAQSIVELGDHGVFTDTRVRNGVRYTYTFTARDKAGNLAVRRFSATPGPRLLSPASGAEVASPPLLTWTTVRHATYYNVQLFRNGRKVLSTWPSSASLRLPSSWSFGNSHFRLRPGHYRWFVWPGFGPRAAARYGPMIGTATFTVLARR